MRLREPIIIAFALLSIISQVSNADEFTLVPDKATIAVPIKATLTIHLKKGERARLPQNFPIPEGAQLIVRKTPPAVQMKDGSNLHTIVWEFVSYKVGAATIDEFEYEIISPDGSIIKRKAEPKSLEIVSVRTDPETANDVKDISPPTQARFRWESYIAPLLILIAILLASLLFWRWFNKRKRPEYVIPPPPALPAHEIAYEQLGKLKADDPFGKGYIKEHFFRLSEITRGYLERRYGLLALERTTPELENEFGGHLAPAQIRSQLFGLLKACDIIKFTKKGATRSQADDAVTRAFELVDSTKKQTEAKTK